MFLNIIRIVCIFSVQVLAFVNFGNGQESLEMIEQGKNQYQLLEERGKLPKYGECWQAAIEHVHEGCRYLSEETQSDIALHITNCFLAMSGHETYKCELDKKPNLRGICINSMSDRAFNVYTEFYTHTQNICWFLRGQIWHEKISENTMQVGQQLKMSVAQQELLLSQQEQSLQIQEKLLQYGMSLEKILNESRTQTAKVMEEMRTSTVKHQQILKNMADSLGGLQSWLIGEISWIDSLIFYLSSAFIIVALTSTPRTTSARLPLLIVLSFNAILERIICNRLTSSNSTSNVLYLSEGINGYIWWCRRIAIFASTIILLILMYTYQDYVAINNSLLIKIHKQNKIIQEVLDVKLSSRRISVHVDKKRNDVDSTTQVIPISDIPKTPIVPSPKVSTPKYNLRSRLTPMTITNLSDIHINKSTV